MAQDRIVVMGVAGSGKSTVGRELALHRGAEFIDGDQLHPAANVAKMAAGIALTDEDRVPWLAAVGSALGSAGRVVVACSALRRSYRDALRAMGEVRFLYLAVGAEEAARRLAGRQGHFMKATMVAGQMAALEVPAEGETDVAAVDATGPIHEVVARAEAALGHPPGGPARLGPDAMLCAIGDRPGGQSWR